jgi:hypothetical protein
LNEYNGRITPFDLPSGRVYKALVEVTISLTSAQKSERMTAGEQLPKPWPWPHQALIDTGSQHTHVKKAIVDCLGLDPVSEDEILSRRLNGAVASGRLYRIRLSFGDGSGKDVTVVAGAAESIPHDMIIGSDLLIDCILGWNGPEGTFGISMLLWQTSRRRWLTQVHPIQQQANVQVGTIVSSGTPPNRWTWLPRLTRYAGILVSPAPASFSSG